MNDDPKAPDTSGSDSSAPRRGGARRWLVGSVVAVALIAAAYGAGSLQGVLSLRKAETAWQKERDQLNATIESGNKERAALKSRQALWQLDSGMSEVLADIADKNYGLARDAAQAMSAVLAGSLADMDEQTRSGLAQLGPLLDDTRRAADSLSPDARINARQAQALIRGALGGPETKKPASTPEHPG